MVSFVRGAHKDRTGLSRLTVLLVIFSSIRCHSLKVDRVGGDR